jgi:hypothetical protein
MGTDVLRFTYGEALNPTMYIIRLTPTEMIVRIGTATDFYPYRPDTSNLSPLDRRLARILEYNYPIDDTSIHHSSRRRHFLDSIGRIYPQLYSPVYYMSILRKEYSLAKPWYRFSSRTIPLKAGEFDTLVSRINGSDYWQLPYDGPPREASFDGCYFSLEASTANQYNFVGTGSSRDTGGFAKACQALVDFAGLERKIDLVWRPRSDTTARHIIVDDVQLEDVKPEPRKHHPKKLHPN